MDSVRLQIPENLKPASIPAIDTITIKKVVKYLQDHLILPSNYEKFQEKQDKELSRRATGMTSCKSSKSLNLKDGSENMFEININSFINNLHSDSSVRNGSFIFDLINKMEKKEILKGKSVVNATSIK